MVRRVFFIHVAKTGGTSLVTNLNRNFGANETYPDPTLDPPDPTRAFRNFTIAHLRSLSEERTRRLRLVKGHFPFMAVEVLGGGFETMTILRHPVDRTISLLRQMQRPGPYRDAPFPGATLEEIYEHPRVYEPLIHDHQTKVFSMTMADEPRGVAQVVHVDQARLELAKVNLETVDVVGLTEHYDAFLDAVVERFGWDVKRDARINAAPTESPPVSAALRRRITDDNAIDVELYEYAIGLVGRRARDRRRVAPE